jgi:prolyl oligopeptidase
MTDQPEWTTVLNVDELAKTDDISWVWKGCTPLPRARDPLSQDGRVCTRSLLQLSRGGSDAIHIKEFDLITDQFVTDQPFVLPEAKTRASYKSRDVLLVGSDFGPDSLTDSGYPRTVREWVRGTDIKDAPTIFEGEKTDVSVSVWIDDQRLRHGGIYEIQSRSITFYTSKYWARKIQYEHLLAPDDPLRQGVDDPPPFVQIDIQEDANVDFLGNLMIISLRSDWEPVPGKVFKQGSLVYVNAHDFLKHGREACEYHVLFEPTERTANDGYSVTQNYLVLSIMDNVKSKLEFYKIEENGTALRLVGSDDEALIRSCSVRPVDPRDGDEFWFTTSGYTQPSTLFMADASNYEKDLLRRESQEWNEPYVNAKLKSLPAQYDASGLTVCQKTAISKDGTEIPYFVIMKEGTVMDGSTPTLLYGYGGFEISLGPSYVATVGLAWLERGGAFVEANIRGGGEFGPSWHQVSEMED